MDSTITNIWKQPEEAENYAKARPDYPPEVVELSLQFLRQKYGGTLQKALDIGCGTGKSTEHLVDKFVTVIGSDLSQAMLDEARKHYAHHGK